MPSIVASDPEDGFIDIALTPTHVIWSTRDGLHRRAKTGGEPELFGGLQRPVSGFVVDAASLYWVEFPGLYAMPLDGSSAPVRIVNDVVTPRAFMPHGSQVFYFSEDPASVDPRDPCSGDVRLVSVPSVGGEPEVLAHDESTRDRPVADDTGLYWAADPPCVDDIDYRPPHYIHKFNFATRTVERFATANGWPQDIQVAGGRVLWIDEGGVWSAPATDGSAAVNLASPPLTRGLATDGINAYWAASLPDGEYSFSANADVYSAPIAGGVPQRIACGVYGIEDYVFVADEHDIYYRSWVRDLIGRLPTSTR